MKKILFEDAFRALAVVMLYSQADPDFEPMAGCGNCIYADRADIGQPFLFVNGGRVEIAGKEVYCVRFPPAVISPMVTQLKPAEAGCEPFHWANPVMSVFDICGEHKLGHPDMLYRTLLSQRKEENHHG